jgi:murein L,D-transpeptidase YcbB/YkuD
MKRFTLTLLASAALAMPAMVPAMAQSNAQTQNNQAQQQSAQQQPNEQPPNQQANAQNGQRNQQQANEQNGQQQNQQQASNQPIQPRQLGRAGVRRVQQALDKDGFKAGRADGIYGHKTRTAVEDFQRSKGIQSHGQMNQQTLADLGVNPTNNQANQSGGQNGNGPDQNGQ